MKLSKQLPLNALRVFEAVARHGSFTRAGDELGMTQTAVSYQIKLLEEAIGEQLFLRQTRQISQTPVAERMLPKVTEAMSLLHEAMDSARKASNEMLEIHAVPTFATLWLARNLGSFQLRHPEIAVRLVRSDQATQVYRQGADVSIEYCNEAPAGLVAHPLLRLEFTPMLSPALAESIGGVKTPADLLRLPVMNETADEEWWRRWLALAGADYQPLKRATINAMGIMDLEAKAAISGQGIAILSPFLFQEELASGRLIQPFPFALPAKAPLSLLYAHAHRRAPKIQAFRAWLESELAGEAATLETR